MKNKMNGFSLIEILITVAIVGILATIAYPSYLLQMQKSRRTDGTLTLLDIQAQLERCYVRTLSYKACEQQLTLPIISPEAYYRITMSNSSETGIYTLTATGINIQTEDFSCAEFSINQLGQRSAKNNQGGNSEQCW